MGALAKSLVLFALNWIDGQLTLFWIHSNVASEGNALMAHLLRLGDGPFMAAKLGVGALAAFLLYRCSHLQIARQGMRLVLTIYIAIMFAHLATGLSALGWSQPLAMITYMTNLPHAMLAIFS
jgi:Domain of unknown function (DUF5658)